MGVCCSRDESLQVQTELKSANTAGGASGSTAGADTARSGYSSERSGLAFNRYASEYAFAPAPHKRTSWYVDSDPDALAWQPSLRVKDSRPSRARCDTDGSGGVESSSSKDPYAGFDPEEWLEMAEAGELDIYSCLGLSDANTIMGLSGAGTRKVMAKVIGVLILQLMVPILMLHLQLENGISMRPRIPDVGFRVIGFALYLYSLYSVYNNALDECRYRLLAFALKANLSSGYWWPLVVGEFANCMVSMVLVFTLFFIYTNASNSVDLILNAVAVNFLGSVDAEMVNAEMLKDGIRAFKDLMAKVQDEETVHTVSLMGKITDKVLGVMLAAIVCVGTVLAFLFLLLSSHKHF